MFASCNVLPRDVPPGDTLEDRAAAVETVLARVRDLPFKHPVPVEEQDKASLKAYLDQSMEKTWDTTGALSERAYKVLGLLPRDLEMKSWSSEFMTDQIAGYYDTDTKRYYTIAQGTSDNDKDLPEPFLLAHELTHALEDQHFDLGATDAKLVNDDDRNLAFHAVCEGSAMDTGVDAAMDAGGFPGTCVSPLLSTMISWLRFVDLANLGDIEFDDENYGTKKLDEAPAIVRSELYFPYVRGWTFVNRLRSEYGFGAIDEALTTPPESSEQILYPDRYVDRLDRPQLVTLPAAPSGFREVQQQTLGLVRMRVLLQSDGDLSDIDGWDGDRYVLWETPTGDAVGLFTVWDSEREAARFADELEEYVLPRTGAVGASAIAIEGTRVAVTINVRDGRAQALADELVRETKVTVQDGDEGPDRWYWRALRWPLAIRPLHKSFEFKVAGNWGIDWRSFGEGYKFRLLNSLALHTENNPDRFGFWMLLGLVGGASDRTVDYSYARVPLLFTWHGRNEGLERRARFGLVANAIRYENDRERKSFDLLWGILFHSKWGEREREGARAWMLGIPIWW
jgi:hypothetical protein